eukprot:SM000075S21973  [mRNA]  locus=s75:361473:366398:- [translate_table: standard]
MDILIHGIENLSNSLLPEDAIKIHHRYASLASSSTLSKSTKGAAIESSCGRRLSTDRLDLSKRLPYTAHVKSTAAQSQAENMCEDARCCGRGNSSKRHEVPALLLSDSTTDYVANGDTVSCSGYTFQSLMVGSTRSGLVIQELAGRRSGELQASSKTRRPEQEMADHHESDDALVMVQPLGVHDDEGSVFDVTWTRLPLLLHCCTSGSLPGGAAPLTFAS